MEAVGGLRRALHGADDGHGSGGDAVVVAHYHDGAAADEDVRAAIAVGLAALAVAAALVLLWYVCSARVTGATVSEPCHVQMVCVPVRPLLMASNSGGANPKHQVCSRCRNPL